jgi:hypothetical protein
MAKRLTANDYRHRHSAVCSLLAALGYISDDMSNATIRSVMKRVKQAEDNLDLIITEKGHYEQTPQLIERCRRNNQNQPRRKA